VRPGLDVSGYRKVLLQMPVSSSDSLSESILARVSDRRAAERRDTPRADAPGDELQVEEVAALWVRLARQRLDALPSIPVPPPPAVAAPSGE
jgi:hypothetical protein